MLNFFIDHAEKRVIQKRPIGLSYRSCRIMPKMMLRKKILRKKGFILTLDAMLAIVVLSVFLLGSMASLSKFRSDLVQEVSLSEEMNSFLASMEKSGILEDSIITSSTANISNMINSMESNTCANIMVRDSANNLIYNITKTGCNSSTDTLSVSRRLFVVNSLPYYAEESGWYG